MLDKTSYIGADLIKNGTFAQAITRTSAAIGVSLWITDPPAVSHLCFHCPSRSAPGGGLKVTDIMEEPSVICSCKDVLIICVIYNPGVRPIQSIEEMGMADCDYLAYRPLADPPSLVVLPSPKPNVFHPWEIGLCPGDGEDFLLAVLRPKLVHLQYDLHVFSSQTNKWTTRLAMLEPPWPGYMDDYLVHESDQVVTLGGGLLGWVDLWRGILLCSVLDTEPVVRYIEFPKPMHGNMWQYLQNPARRIRDVSFADGVIMLVEMEDHISGPLTSGSMLETKKIFGARNTEPCTPDGWSSVTWCRELSSDGWTLDCMAYVSAISILSQMKPNHSESSALKSLKMAGPLWRMDGGDIVYLLAKADFKDKIGWAVAFNTRKSKLHPFQAERVEFFSLSYQPFALSKLSPSVSPVCYIPERQEDSKGNTENSMVLVDGLDPDVTVNQLQAIVALFGELSFLKICTNEQYGLVGYVCRSCAEQAISSLNGAQIGRHCVHVSWGRGKLNKQQPERMRRERKRARYHPYTHCYGVP